MEYVSNNSNYYYYYSLLQFSFHSVAVVLTVVQSKQIRLNIRKRNKTKTQYKQYKTVYTITHITKTPTHNAHPHITKQVKTTTVQVTYQTKQSQHNQVPSVKGHPNVYGAFIPKSQAVTYFTSLQNNITSHKSRQFTPHHYTSHHFTYLHSFPT